MKYNRQFILAMFNRSKSGKSYLFIDGTKMYMISETVYNMIKNGEIDEVEFSENGELKNDDGTKAFDTFRVKAWVDSLISKFTTANKLIEAAAAFDNDAYAKAKKIAEGLVI